MTMVERVARAIAACPRDASDRERARAAIQAIREPTKDMLSAGLLHGSLRRAYTAILDAALSEGGGNG